jgi:oxaloacetate decarboxylase gamma subunit
MSHFELGLLLMVVGMTTVFFVLLLVISLGKGLTWLVNRYAPQETATHPSTRPGRNTSAGTTNHKPPLPQEDDRTTAAIVAAVSAFTAGNGKVTEIKKTIKS